MNIEDAKNCPKWRHYAVLAHQAALSGQLGKDFADSVPLADKPLAIAAFNFIVSTTADDYFKKWWREQEVKLVAENFDTRKLAADAFTEGWNMAFCAAKAIVGMNRDGQINL